MLSTLIQGFGPDVHAIIVIVMGVWAGTLGLPVPEEIPLLTAGLFAALGVLPLPWAIVIGILACFSGDITVFAVGRRIGRGLQSHPYLRRLMRGRYLLRARHLYLHKGHTTMFVARLLPGLKMPFLFTAGAFRMEWGRFIVRDLGCLLILVPTLVMLAYSSSVSIAQLGSLVHQWALYGVILFIAAAAAGSFLSWQARRRRLAWRAKCVAAGMKFRAPVTHANLTTQSWD